MPPTFILVSFNSTIPDKIGNGINVINPNKLRKMNEGYMMWRFAIAEHDVDATVDGEKIFCVRLDDSQDGMLMIGFMPQETFDKKSEAHFGGWGFGGCGLAFRDGQLYYPEHRSRPRKSHEVIDDTVAMNTEELVVILTVSDGGKKKTIRFLCDGKESETTEVSEILNADRVFPAFCFLQRMQTITTIEIDQIKTRTPEIDRLIQEYQNQKQNNNENDKNNNDVSSSTSQLQKELYEALQKIAALSSQLQQEKQKSSNLENELQKLKEQTQK
jgi:hypothetical protein